MGSMMLYESYKLELREREEGVVDVFVHDTSGKAPVKALSIGVRKTRFGSYPVVRRALDYSGQTWREEELLTPEGRPDVIQLHSGKLFCKTCNCFVQNTANNEMRKEGFFAHSHVCGKRDEVEKYVSTPCVVDSYDASDNQDKRQICTVAYHGETYDVMFKPDTGLIYIMESDSDPAPETKEDEAAIIEAAKKFLKE